MERRLPGPGIRRPTDPDHGRQPRYRGGPAARIPLRRLGAADDCAGAYLFLASPRLAGYITGQIAEVNGGQAMP